MHVLRGKTLRILPLACLGLLAAATAHASGNTLAATPNPVHLGEQLELQATFAQVTANASAVTRFYRFVAEAPVDELLATVNSPTTGTGTNFAEATLLTADLTLFPDECEYFYATTVTNGANIYQTDALQICRASWPTETVAETVSRILPVFSAPVSSASEEAPTGTVEFYVDDELVCAGELDESGEAQCSPWPTLLFLDANYTAVYVGDDLHASSEDLGAFFP